MDFCTCCRTRVRAATVAWEATAVPGAMPAFLAPAARVAMAVPVAMLAHLGPAEPVAMAPFSVTEALAERVAMAPFSVTAALAARVEEAPFLVMAALAARVEKAPAAREATAVRVGMRLALVGAGGAQARATTASGGAGG